MSERHRQLRHVADMLLRNSSCMAPDARGMAQSGCVEWATLAGLLLLATTAGAAGPATDIKSTLLAEWNSVAARIQTMRCELSIERYARNDGRELRLFRKDRVRILYAPPGRLGEINTERVNDQMEVAERDHTLTLTNERYRANLKRAKEADAWLLLGYQDASAGDTDVTTLRQCLPWLTCGNIFLPDWIADDCFVVERVADVGGGAVQRIHFRHDEARRRSLRKEVLIPVVAGHLDVEPGAHYRVVGYRFAIKTRYSAGTQTGSLTYKRSDSIPVLTEIASNQETESEKFGSQASREIRTYSVSYNDTIDPEDFRLSQYGLPEPHGVEWRKPTPTYVWLLLAAGACGVLAIGCRWLVQRRRSGT